MVNTFCMLIVFVRSLGLLWRDGVKVILAVKHHLTNDDASCIVTLDVIIDDTDYILIDMYNANTKT